MHLQANLDDVVRVMAMPSAQFGDNLQQYLKRNEPEDSRTMPEDLAYNCINANVRLPPFSFRPNMSKSSMEQRFSQADSARKR